MTNLKYFPINYEIFWMSGFLSGQWLNFVELYKRVRKDKKNFNNKKWKHLYQWDFFEKQILLSIKIPFLFPSSFSFLPSSTFIIFTFDEKDTKKSQNKQTIKRIFVPYMLRLKVAAAVINSGPESIDMHHRDFLLSVNSCRWRSLSNSANLTTDGWACTKLIPHWVPHMHGNSYWKKF